MNDSVNYKIPIIFQNLKKNDAHVIMQELGKFDFKKCHTKWFSILLLTSQFSLIATNFYVLH